MKFSLPLAFCLLSVAGTAIFAQNPPQQPPTQQNDQQNVTLTGCLSKGETAGEYTLTDTKSGQKFTFSGPEKLDNYVNHTVQLTGKMNGEGDKAFQPATIKTVSNSCEGGGR